MVEKIIDVTRVDAAPQCTEPAAQRHVLPHREPRVQQRLLEDHGIGVATAADAARTDTEFAAGRFLQPRQEPEESGLTDAGRAEEDERLTGPDLQIEVGEQRPTTGQPVLEARDADGHGLLEHSGRHGATPSRSSSHRS